MILIRKITARSGMADVKIMETFFLAEDPRAIRTPIFQDLLRRRLIAR
jgi:hypothetical protein